ncbi:MAG: polysaccharide biosynthesis protein, partial [Acidimicrobiales bacterium]|nr:polysaccharide biosynthesis protein [Acidimicrobiales bacterium]
MTASRDGIARSRVQLLLQHSGSRGRRRLQVVADIASMVVAAMLAMAFRYDFDVPASLRGRMVWFALLSGVVFAICGAARGLYAGRWSFGSFEEMSALVGAIVLATAALVVGVAAVHVDSHRIVPLSVPLIASTIMLTFGAGVRYVWRLFLERHLRPQSDAAERLVVIGAGEGGQQIITAMLRNPSGRYLPVAIIDDDPTKQNLRIRNVPVCGTNADLAAVARSHDASTVLLAIPTADSTLVRTYADLARANGLRLLVLPSVGELYGAEVSTADIRPVTHADLLGRHEVDTDVDSIAGYVTGKRVLVTGAGGSIGSELSRQLYRFAPASLVLL